MKSPPRADQERALAILAGPTLSLSASDPVHNRIYERALCSSPLTLDEARDVAQAALELDSPDAVWALVRERVPAADVG